MAWKRLDDITKDQIADFKRKFRSKARFLIDESLGRDVSIVIRDLGWNAVYVEEVGLTGHCDEDVYAYAWRDDRILLTHDLDFLDDHRFPPHRNPGLTVLPGATAAGTGLDHAIATVLLLVGPYRYAHRGHKIQISEDGIWMIKSFSKKEGLHRRTRLRLGAHDQVWEWIGEPDDDA